ncbi:hypothetical protein BGX27_011394 [Mortierella sp. AM989]|nr:hypothetical protein BGX27_011394 [Mortierella sp. AM989]
MTSRIEFDDDFPIFPNDNDVVNSYDSDEVSENEDVEDEVGIIANDMSFEENEDINDNDMPSERHSPTSIVVGPMKSWTCQKHMKPQRSKSMPHPPLAKEGLTKPFLLLFLNNNNLQISDHQDFNVQPRLLNYSTHLLPFKLVNREPNA